MITVLAFLAAVVTGVILSFLFSWPVYWLWNNALIGAVDGVHTITWLQAWGIMILFHILFKATLESKKDSKD